METKTQNLDKGKVRIINVTFAESNHTMIYRRTIHTGCNDKHHKITGCIAKRTENTRNEGEILLVLVEMYDIGDFSWG